MKKEQLSAWRFILADIKEACQKDYDDQAWEAVTVPHDWSIQQDFTKEASSGTGYLPGGIGWYRGEFQLSAANENKTLRLVFEGVYKNAQVWVNGYHVGARPSGYATFSFDITEIASYSHDKRVVVAVRVDHTDIADSRWYNGSGINRPVWLESHEKIQLAENGTFFITEKCNESAAEIQLEQTIVNTSDEAAQVEVTQVLTPLNRTGESYEFSQAVKIAANSKAIVTFTETLLKPDLWSADTPNLYRLETQLKNSTNDTVANYAEFVGIRQLHFDPDQGFFVNGQSTKIKGVCLHEDAGCFGTAVPAPVWLRRLLTLKEAGTNGIRMAHNPHSKLLYRLCDLLGFYVIDEAFDEWENPKNKWWQGHNVYPPKHEGYAEYFPNWYQADLENMIAVNKNHPSIISWSIGNEIDYPNDPYANPLFNEMTGNNDASKPEAERVFNPNRPDTRRLSTIAAKLAAITKACDKTRPVTLAAAFPELSSQIGFLDHLDLIGYNYKEHLYAEDHQRFPKQPFIGSENGHGYQQWLAVKDNDYISGQYLWTGVDYLGEAHGWPIHGSGAGLLTLAGMKKSNWYLRQSWWTEEPMVKLFTRPKSEDNFDYWPFYQQWSYQIDEAVEVYAFSNCDEVTVSAADTIWPLSYDEESGYFKGVIPATSDMLEAIGKKGTLEVTDRLWKKQMAADFAVAAWEIPEELRSAMSALGLLSEGDQLYQLHGQLVDDQGRLAAEDRQVQVTVSEGTLLGLENGDLADITAYNVPIRSTFEGNLMIFIQGNAKTKVTIKVAGLADQEIILK